VAHQQLQGLQQGDAGLEQGQQLLVEEDQGLGLEGLLALEGAHGAAHVHGEVPLGHDLGLHLGSVAALEVPHEDLAGGCCELHGESHGQL